MTGNISYRPFVIAAIEVLVLAVVVLVALGQTPSPYYGIHVLTQPARQAADIKEIEGPEVPPVIYTSVFSFAELNVEVKKKKFLDMLLPAILISKYKLARKRERVRRIMAETNPAEEDMAWLGEQFARYETADYEQLLRRLEDHPTSIVLAQAAVETGWGESRFFVNANNVFGVWSFDPADSRVMARQTRQGKIIYVKKYRSIVESVDDYFLTIAKGPYARFRRARKIHDDPWKLVPFLTNYSEQRIDYVRRLYTVLKRNNLERFDSYHLDPDFI